MSSTVIDAGSGMFRFTDADGDQITLRLSGPGAATITFPGDALDNADIQSIDVIGSTSRTRLKITIDNKPPGDDAIVLGDVNVDGSLGALQISGGASDSTIIIDGELRSLQVRGDAGDLRLATEALRSVRIDGTLDDGSIIASAGDIDSVMVRGNVEASMVLAGAGEFDTFSFATADLEPATIRRVDVRGDMMDAVIAAGGNPGADGLFADGELLAGGAIDSLRIGGLIIGTAASAHPNAGVYAAEFGRVQVAGTRYDDPKNADEATVGTAVIDPLASPANALTVDDIERIIEQAVARAVQLGVAATISVVDREGNLLAVVRMAGALEMVDIDAGGVGGLEAVDGIVATSLIAATKAGTAAFLSTSRGNAFTTRTAGYIIQEHFPPGIDFRPGGPLFGVQLSQLPTSDVNRLPLGLSADPGGLPLYRGGELLGGVGIEVDGTYTVDPTRVGGRVTVEESIALAAQAGMAPPANIRADRIFIDGIRLDYANGNPPRIASLGVLPDYDALVGAATLAELVVPRVSPASKFAAASIDTSRGTINGEVPDNIDQDFFDAGTGTFQFLNGDLNGAEQLTAADVETILANGHALNSRLRAAIRRDNPKVSRVTVSVVDLNGNLLGVFRSEDAPVFGYDVSVQKARTAAFFSRPDAGAELTALDTEVDVAAIEMALPALWAVTNPYGEHVEAAAAVGVNLDGTVAIADRSNGFLSRPNLPDGIQTRQRGPFSAQGGDDQFSPFNTGLQTDLIIPQLVEFLLAFNGMDEATALNAFAAGTFGGGGVVPLESNADPGGLNTSGLPGNSLANGAQIFAGSVPLYKNGVLVGAVGVSGDGIEQDDMVAFAAAGGFLDPDDPGFFQEFGPGIRRADEVVLTTGVRLPYVKFPRSPFTGN